MKILFSTLSLFLVSHFSNAQNFYKSIADYNAGKPMENVMVASGSWRMVMGRETVELEKDKTTERTKLSNLPSELFTYNGKLMRVYDGHLYYVLVEGKYCYYVMKNESQVTGNCPSFFIYHEVQLDPNGKDIGNVRDYFSESITGEIDKLKNKKLKDFLKEKGLDTQFDTEEPKREKKDSKDSFISKEINRNAKFIAVLNSK
jgi:hypothetical protein